MKTRTVVPYTAPTRIELQLVATLVFGAVTVSGLATIAALVMWA